MGFARGGGCWAGRLANRPKRVAASPALATASQVLPVFAGARPASDPVAAASAGPEVSVGVYCRPVGGAGVNGSVYEVSTGDHVASLLSDVRPSRG